MFRNTALKATHSGMLRGATSSTCRRSIHLATSARSASKPSGFSMTARRPLAVVDRAFNGARSYAAPSECTTQGVVSNNNLHDR
jgi:2-oxoglutarate dehydrogenase E1 component